jgi:hypothetical protein
VATFFTDPEAAGGGEFLDTAEVGIRFTLPAGTINYLRVYWPAVAPGGTPVMRLWDGAGSLIQTINFDTTALSGWNNATPAVPIAVSAGNYVVSWGTTRYKAIVGFFSGGSVTRGSITAVGGRFAAVGSFPSSSSAAAYVADLDFTPSGGSSPSLTDTGTAADNIAGTASTPLAQAGSAAEVLTAGVATPLAQPASSAEALIATVTVALADSASAADAVSNGAGTPKSLSDAASAADAFTVAAGIAVTDTGAAAQALTAAAAVGLAEAGTGVDAVTTPTRTLQLADAATAAQVLTAAVTLPLSDTGTAVDAATGVDDSNIVRTLTDTGSGSDGLRVRRLTIRPSSGITARPYSGITPRP